MQRCTMEQKEERASIGSTKRYFVGGGKQGMEDLQRRACPPPSRTNETRAVSQQTSEASGHTSCRERDSRARARDSGTPQRLSRFPASLKSAASFKLSFMPSRGRERGGGERWRERLREGGRERLREVERGGGGYMHARMCMCVCVRVRVRV